MNIKLAPLLENIKASFWFVPSIMILSTLIMVVITVWIDINAMWGIKQYFPIIYASDAQAIRSLLGTIAASMITVTSIAFSITVVSLTLASSQFGPRLMRNFMKDSTTQRVLGMFISNFLYCIFVFCAISLQPPFQFTPGATVIWALLMTCLSVGFLIHFIHHVAKSIQADSVVEDVYCELKLNIDKLLSNKVPTSKLNEHALAASFDESNYTTMHALRSEHSGYVQVIDIDGLITFLSASNYRLKLHVRQGDYLIQGSVFADIYSDTTIDDCAYTDIQKFVVLGATRTPVQDPEFAVHQLVEIALRALSPGINDPYTAITCIDKLSSTLCKLSTRTFPSALKLDANNICRLHCKTLTFEDIGNAAFNQIRQHGNNNISITIRLLESLCEIAKHAHSKEHYEFVRCQVEMIKEQQKEQNLAKYDALAFQQRLALVENYLKS